MKIGLTSVLVDDQAKALKFYTGVLGFEKQVDLPMGEHRWLTVVSPEGAAGVELLLEPISLTEARTYQQALLTNGIPTAVFFTDDIQAEYKRLKTEGVVFKSEPHKTGPVLSAVFEDTCGNLINLTQYL